MGDTASAPVEKTMNRRRSICMDRRLSFPQQKLQRLRQSPGPVRFTVLVTLKLHVAQGIGLIALSQEHPVERATVAQFTGPFVGADVEIDPSARRPCSLHVAQN